MTYIITLRYVTSSRNKNTRLGNYNLHYSQSQSVVIACSRMSESVNVLEENDEGNVDTLPRDFLMSLHMDDMLPFEDKVIRSKRTTQHQQRYRQRRATFSKTLKFNDFVNENGEPDISAFDESTNEILKRIFTRNYGYIAKCGKVVGMGDNSIIIHAWIMVKSKQKYSDYPKWEASEYAVKVYRVSEDRIKNEKVFRRVQNEKEHLLCLHDANNIPKVRQASQNVLVMGMVGTGQATAPTIASAPLNHSQELYHTMVKELKTWYNISNLVHGKLSTRNILYWKNKLYYTGWSHSVSKEHPLALKKLMRDCNFVTKFFRRRLVPVKPTNELFKHITGLTGWGKIISSENLWKTNLTNPNRLECSISQNSSGKNCRFKSKTLERM